MGYSIAGNLSLAVLIFAHPVWLTASKLTCSFIFTLPITGPVAAAPRNLQQHACPPVSGPRDDPVSSASS